MQLTKKELAGYLETTILKPEGTRHEVIELCEQAIPYEFVVACVHPQYVSLANSILKDSPVMIMTPAGFPFGANTTASKVFEAQDAIKNGADEIDMMIFMGALKDRLYDVVRDDIRAVVEAAEGRTVKAIVETALLSREEKITACKIAVEAGAKFVKTSTGNALPGATVEDIRLMKEAVAGSDCGVKASGGINELKQVLSLIEAGATRIASRLATQITNSLED
jgi:deoxyribose-phosphate aldolase